MAIRYKVRPSRREYEYEETANVLCAPELAAMLSCFAATGDLRAASEGVAGCASAARSLQACMAKRQPTANRSKSGSINYLLRTIKK